MTCRCTTCKGKGTVKIVIGITMRPFGYVPIERRIICNACEGSGEVLS